MTVRRTAAVACLVAVAVILSGTASFAARKQEQEKRARPPKWSAEVLDVFFEDAREKLVGERPDYGSATAVAVAPSAADADDDGAAAQGADASWSKLIDADTIETEIKRLAQAVARDVTTPGAFKGGGFEACRRHFSTLAAMFAVAAEYDAQVRWRDSAAALRDVFARAGRNCKVGTDQTFNEASQRKQDLADLVRGSRPALPAAERSASWGQVADRPPLMQRLEMAHQERLLKWLANERQFEEHGDDVRHEAQLVAAIAEVIGREGFDYWDEEEYAKPARALRDAAAEISAAVELNNYEQARQAIGRATKACTECHEMYRG